MIDYREILELDSLGYSRWRIHSIVNSSYHTVEDTLKEAHDTGITWPLGGNATHEEIKEILFLWKYVSDSVYAMPDFAHIHRELARTGVTLTLLWEEYCIKVRSNGSVPHSCTQFWREVPSLGAGDEGHHEHHTLSTGCHAGGLSR